MIYLEPEFYAAIAILFVALQLRPDAATRTQWFGLLNLAAVCWLFGLRALVALTAMSVVLWLALRVHAHLAAKSTNSKIIDTGVAAAIYAAIAALFLFHKVILDFLGTGWVASPANQAKPTAAVSEILQVIAFSYVCLRLIDVTRAVTAGARLLDPVSMSGYLLPFFMTPAGPINVYELHIKMDETPQPQPSWQGLIVSADVLTSGLLLKYVVAEAFRIFFIGAKGDWPTVTVADTGCAFVYVFFDFLGYSLIALGTGRLLDVPTPVNFKAPFISQSLTEFWTRWHVSLGDFVRRSIFIPTQVALVRRFGRARAHATNLAALMISFGLVGLWHRLSWTFLLWGLGVGLVMALEKVAAPRLTRLSKRHTWLGATWRFAGPVYVLMIVVLTLHMAMPELLGQTR
jgi:D-alanyl-lipoteichoic acid acyltransferase DltB (MBOAT superfamily)